jgi:hypothetical protein
MRIKPVIQLNNLISPGHPYKFRVYYEYKDTEDDSAPASQVFPPQDETAGDLAVPGVVPVDDMASAAVAASSVGAADLSLDASRPGSERLETTLQHVDLPDAKKDYIRTQVHARLCSLTAELLDAMPDDPSEYLKRVLKAKGTATATGESIPPPAEAGTSSGDEILKLEASEKKKVYLKKVHPFISAIVNYLLQNSPENIDQCLYDGLTAGTFDKFLAAGLSA